MRATRPRRLPTRRRSPTSICPPEATPAAESDGLSEACVVLDNNSGAGAPSLLCSDPVEIVTAETPEQVRQALQRSEAAVKDGLHAAGFFAYELGYALEPKLASLMPP